MFRDLALTVDLSDEDKEIMCGCGTNCSVCTGTGTGGCPSPALDKEDVLRLQELLEAK